MNTTVECAEGFKDRNMLYWNGKVEQTNVAIVSVLTATAWRRERVSVHSFLTLRRLMSYIYGAPILDVSRSHTTTQHSR